MAWSRTRLPNEDRIVAPVHPTYDNCPEMAALENHQSVLTAIKRIKHGLIVLNDTSPDMVGHTHHWAATQTAIKTIGV